MLRIRILASTIPLLLAGLFAGGNSSATRPCLALGDGTVQIAPSWQAGFRVYFTDDPAQATARVQIVDQPENADFAVSDDSVAPTDAACSATSPARLVGIANSATGADAVIYLSRDDGGDYRVYVRSSSLSPREAAALVVSAGGTAPRVMAAALAGGS